MGQLTKKESTILKRVLHSITPSQIHSGVGHAANYIKPTCNAYTLYKLLQLI